MTGKWKYFFIAGISYFVVTFAAIGVIGHTARPVVYAQAKQLKEEASQSLARATEAQHRVETITDISTRPKIKEAIQAVEEARASWAQEETDFKAFVQYIEEHKDGFSEKDYSLLSKVTRLVEEKTYLDYHLALRHYLDASIVMLRYSSDNYDFLQQGRKQEVRQYDQLYSSYKLALEEQNQAYARHMDFVRQYADKHPEVAELLTKRLK
jgi:hypothetical protein